MTTTKLIALLDEVQYILSIEYDSKKRNLELSLDTVNTLREKYLDLMEVWETLESILTSQT